MDSAGGKAKSVTLIFVFVIPRPQTAEYNFVIVDAYPKKDWRDNDKNLTLSKLLLPLRIKIPFLNFYGGFSVLRYNCGGNLFRISMIRMETPF